MKVQVISVYELRKFCSEVLSFVFVLMQIQDFRHLDLALLVTILPPTQWSKCIFYFIENQLTLSTSVIIATADIFFCTSSTSLMWYQMPFGTCFHMPCTIHQMECPRNSKIDEMICMKWVYTSFFLLQIDKISTLSYFAPVLWNLIQECLPHAFKARYLLQTKQNVSYLFKNLCIETLQMMRKLYLGGISGETRQYQVNWCW